MVLLFYGVSDGARTRGNQGHNLVLYQLSYTHHNETSCLTDCPAHFKQFYMNSDFFSNRIQDYRIGPSGSGTMSISGALVTEKPGNLLLTIFGI